MHLDLHDAAALQRLAHRGSGGGRGFVSRCGGVGQNGAVESLVNGLLVQADLHRLAGLAGVRVLRVVEMGLDLVVNGIVVRWHGEKMCQIGRAHV